MILKWRRAYGWFLLILLLHLCLQIHGVRFSHELKRELTLEENYADTVAAPIAPIQNGTPAATPPYVNGVDCRNGALPLISKTRGEALQKERRDQMGGNFELQQQKEYNKFFTEAYGANCQIGRCVWNYYRKAAICRSSRVEGPLRLLLVLLPISLCYSHLISISITSYFNP